MEGSFALPELGDSPSTSAAAALANLIESHHDKTKACVERVLAAFDADLAAGSIGISQNKDLENVAVHWFPPEGWAATSGGVVKGLATKTQMSASWNGCVECPVVLRPFVKPPPPPKKVPVETIAAALRGMGVVYKDNVAPEDLLAAATMIAGVGDLFASHIAGFQLPGERRIAYGEQDPCPHQQHTPMFRRPCISQAY
jgi:hypothetical protein